MDYPTIFGIIGLAALIHASFQLSISMVTLLSGHSLVSKAKASRALHLAGAFFAGVVVMTMLFVSFLAYLATQLLPHSVPALAWSAVAGISIGLGVAVWAFYYRRTKVGTTLWIPRPMARFLSERTKATTLGAESFSLGLVSVIAEGIFIIAPASAAALALTQLPAPLQLVGIALYTGVASLGILVVIMLIGGGHKLSRIQKWREDNKRFMQFAAGSALLVLGFYMYVNEVVAAVTTVTGGL